MAFKKEEVAFIKRWSEDQLWEDQKVFLRNSWIGIEGLPFELWNSQSLKDIGVKLGGLIETAKETIDLSFLQFAKIRCKGFVSGLIEPELALGSFVHLRLFNLGAPVKSSSSATPPGYGSLQRLPGARSKEGALAEVEVNHCVSGS